VGVDLGSRCSIASDFFRGSQIPICTIIVFLFFKGWFRQARFFLLPPVGGNAFFCSFPTTCLPPYALGVGSPCVGQIDARCLKLLTFDFSQLVSMNPTLRLLLVGFVHVLWDVIVEAVRTDVAIAGIISVQIEQTVRL
jgi:hypothetical protein